jgi:HlyD family secretion protein
VTKFVIGGALAVVAILGGLAIARPSLSPVRPAPAPAAMAAVASTDGAPVEIAPVAQQRAARNLPAVVEARLVPVNAISMSFEVGGVVREVLVEEGDIVSAGDPLVRLDSRASELKVLAARADFEAALADRNLAAAGATPATVEQQQARLERARAALALAQAEVTRQDVTAIERRVEKARLLLERLEAGPNKEELSEAQESLAQAQLALQAASNRFSSEKTRQELEVKDYANRLRDYQDAYRLIQTANQQKGEFEPGDAEREAVALRAVENATRDLQEQRVLLEQARRTEELSIHAAESGVRAAEARLRRLTGSPDADEIAAARAERASAEADLTRAEGEPRSRALELAEAEVRMAEADFARITEAPRPVDLAVFDARVKKAEAQLKQAELAVEQATLRAPADATIAALNLRPGEAVSPETRGVVVLGDLSAWELETEDLSELSVADIREGDRVTIGFYALPDLKIPGTVTRIRPLGTATTGSETTFALAITPDESDARLRWNMTANVTILPPEVSP